MTTEQARDLLLSLLAQEKREQEDMAVPTPDTRRITAMAALGRGTAAVQFADGTEATITVTVTPAPEGGAT